MKPSWNNSGWLADSLQIYPNRTKTEKTYENDRDNIVETKNKNERLRRLAMLNTTDIWHIDDVESDEEIAEKMR